MVFVTSAFDSPADIPHELISAHTDEFEHGHLAKRTLLGPTCHANVGVLEQSVDLLLLVYTDLTWAHVDQQEETTHDRQSLEEIVLGEIFVWVVRMKLSEVLAKLSEIA